MVEFYNIKNDLRFSWDLLDIENVYVQLLGRYLNESHLCFTPNCSPDTKNYMLYFPECFITHPKILQGIYKHQPCFLWTCFLSWSCLEKDSLLKNMEVQSDNTYHKQTQQSPRITKENTFFNTFSHYQPGGYVYMVHGQLWTGCLVRR